MCSGLASRGVSSLRNCSGQATSGVGSLMNRGADAGHALKEWLRQSEKMMMVGNLLSHTVILIFEYIWSY